MDADLQALCDAKDGEMYKMQAEIERLRGLLREAALMDEGDMSIDVDEWMQRVREALDDDR